MVFVPAGEFLMGANADDPLAQPNEKPQHKVYLDAFWIDRTEVTYAQYATFLTAIGGNRHACGGYDCIPTHHGEFPIESSGIISKENGQYVVEPRIAEYPVNVTWYGARVYCEHHGMRLPTEAEWEKAARGTDGRVYPWGDEWQEDRIGSKRSPVASHPGDVSPYGALDMAGSAGEWVADWFYYEYYVNSPYRNPLGPDEGMNKTKRSGFIGAGGNARSARTTMRRSGLPDFQSAGFRCVRDVDE
jgi:formylglycine-generating enzyme required for sulfatase activity